MARQHLGGVVNKLVGRMKGRIS